MGVEEFAPVLDYEVGDNVRVVSGPLENFIGIVEEIIWKRKRCVFRFDVRKRDTCGT